MLEQGIDTSTPGGWLVFHFLAALAEYDREMIVERTMDGLAAARARGRVGGRPPALTQRQLDQAQRMYDAGEHTVEEIAETFRVGRTIPLPAAARLHRRRRLRAGRLPQHPHPQDRRRHQPPLPRDRRRREGAAGGRPQVVPDRPGPPAAAEGDRLRRRRHRRPHPRRRGGPGEVGHRRPRLRRRPGHQAADRAADRQATPDTGHRARRPPPPRPRQDPRIREPVAVVRRSSALAPFGECRSGLRLAVAPTAATG
ncbi:recombinase family protein [Amycolatopsis sp. NPDC051903]|uniref:recombinase family protein n=1 Tax=Amycolatopsis sp. NPDC051903 TaxID=3363936 RepID=UPI00378FDC73